MLCETGDLTDLRRQGYVSEEKLDGTRVFIVKENGVVTLRNRHGIDYTKRLPEIVKAAQQIPVKQFKIDGEAIYINPKTGEIEFTGSQIRCSTHFPDFWLKQDLPIRHKGFDLLMLNGEDIRDKPYYVRKQFLEDLLEIFSGCTGNKTIEYVPFRKDCVDHFEEVKKADEEGLVLKDVNSRYEDARSYSWLKVKNWRPPEVCEVVGFTQGKNARKGFFGSLVLARNGKYRGKAGSGFNDWELRQVKDILSDAPRVAKPLDIGELYTAVKTDLKVKVKYYKITENGVMRFPVFLEVIQ